MTTYSQPKSRLNARIDQVAEGQLRGVLARGQSFVASGASGDSEGSREYKAILSQSFAQKYQSN